MNVNVLMIYILIFLALEVVALLFLSFNDLAFATACGFFIMYLHQYVPKKGCDQ